MRKSPRRGLQRVLCFRKLPMMHRADWAAGPAAAWSSPGSTGTATIAGRSLSISEAASPPPFSEAVTTTGASAIERGHRERAPAVDANALHQQSLNCCAAYRRRPDARH